MIEVFKIKIIRKYCNTQYKKKEYYSKAKFMKYGKEIYSRYHNVRFYNSLETYCEIYKLKDDSWELIEVPKEFNI